MARMIPAGVPENCKSRGEYDLFLRLRDDPGARDWIVLHSLDIAEHRVKLSGELDFVVIIPGMGVLCLEVKACHHLRRDDRGWYYGHNTEPDPRGPFKQASQGLHSLRDFVREHRPGLHAAPLYWSAVIFPYINFPLESPEWHPWQVVDAEGYRAFPISRLLSGILDRAHHYLESKSGPAFFRPGKGVPLPQQCLDLAEALRPRFEFFEAPRSRHAHLKTELRRYTDEQFLALDAMERNPRVVFQGPAGTGKTLLAVEAARRSRSAGHRALLLCFNRHLGDWLEQETDDLRPEVTTRTLHSQMILTAAGSASGHSRSSQFWKHELPDLALEQMLDGCAESSQYDELILDEAQDMLKPQYLDFLDLSLRGGLAAGRWRFFGDFENQTIYSDNPLSGEREFGNLDDLTLTQFVQARGVASPIYNLRTNCRNTPRIATWAETLGEISPGYQRILRQDDRVEPELLSYDGNSEQLLLLATALRRLLDENFKCGDIMILSARGSEVCAASLLQEPWPSRVRAFNKNRGGYIHFCTIHAFKGLESPAVIVTDIERYDALSIPLLYVAATRALCRLIVLTHRSVHEEIIRRVLGKAMGRART